VVSGALLPKSAQGEFYTWFHIDEEDHTGEGGAREFFFHVIFRRTPEGPPPAAMALHRKEGRTVEWLLKSLDAVVGNENPSC
jgi:hypothetical protein